MRLWWEFRSVNISVVLCQKKNIISGEFTSKCELTVQSVNGNEWKDLRFKFIDKFSEKFIDSGHLLNS